MAQSLTKPEPDGGHEISFRRGFYSLGKKGRGSKKCSMAVIRPASKVSISATLPIPTGGRTVEVETDEGMVAFHGMRPHDDLFDHLREGFEEGADSVLPLQCLQRSRVDNVRMKVPACAFHI